MNIENIDGIVFDMDGVIFDTERIGLECWKQIGKSHDLENVEEVCMKCIGRSTVDTMKIVEDNFGKFVPVEQLYAESRVAISEYINDNGLPMKKGVVELLTYLKNVGMKIGLASSTSYTTVVYNLKMADIFKYFSVIIGGDMIEHSKPNPEIYLLACKKMNINPTKSFAVEDSRNGIISASNAGMLPILVPDLIEPDSEMLSLSYVKKDNLLDFLDYIKL